ncbi:MAG: TolC family protein [Acidobacteriota bacterium]
MKVGMLVWGVWCSAALASAEEPPAPLSLSAALQEAATTSLQAQVADLDSQVAREETRQIRALYYPTVNADVAHYNLDNDPYFVFGDLQFPAGEQVFWRYRFDVREIVWDWGRRKAATAASVARESAVTTQGADSVRQAQMRTLVAYMEAITLASRRTVVDQRVAALKDHLRVVQDQFDHGVVARNELLQTEVALRNVMDQAADLDDKIALARRTLNASMGRSPSSPLVLPPSLVPPPSLPWDTASCASKALENNTTVKALSDKLAAELKLLQYHKKDFYPSFIVQAYHQYEQNRYLLYPHVTGLFYGMTWNVYDGGARSSKVREDVLAAEKTRCLLEDAKRGVEIMLEQAYRDYEQALRETETARVNVGASRENLRILEDQYKEGIVRTTDVLDAESLLAESRFTLAAQRYKAYQKQGAVLALMGENLSGFYQNLAMASTDQEED